MKHPQRSARTFKTVQKLYLTSRETITIYISLNTHTQGVWVLRIYLLQQAYVKSVAGWHSWCW